MRRVRPTIKAIKDLPRDSFPDPAVHDRVTSLKSATREAREQILTGLRLYRVQHPLLKDAQSYFDTGRLPDVHQAATAARSTKHGKIKPVYEVRSHTGAAWRGGVIKDDEGDPWLVYANSHDEFHASASQVFADEKRYWPSSIDMTVREMEESEAASEAEDIACLAAMIEALSRAVQHTPEKREATLHVEGSEPFRIAFEVELGEDSGAPATAHESLGQVSVTIEIDIRDFELRSRMLRLCLPFLQPDPGLRDVVYGQDRSTVLIILMMTHAQLAQALVTTTTGDTPRPADIPEPLAQHFFQRNRLASAFVYGEALQSLCGIWIVPTTEGELAEHLPVCNECEAVEPVAQAVLDLARRS